MSKGGYSRPCGSSPLSRAVEEIEELQIDNAKLKAENVRLMNNSNDDGANNTPALLGWQCPVCKGANSPYVATCQMQLCGMIVITSSSGSGS